jgi:hypothetical protein
MRKGTSQTECLRQHRAPEYASLKRDFRSRKHHLLSEIEVPNGVSVTLKTWELISIVLSALVGGMHWRHGWH